MLQKYFSPTTTITQQFWMFIWWYITTIIFISTKNYGTNCFMKEIYPLNNILCPLLNQSSAIMNQKIFCSLKIIFTVGFEIFSLKYFLEDYLLSKKGPFELKRNCSWLGPDSWVSTIRLTINMLIIGTYYDDDICSWFRTCDWSNFLFCDV